MLIEKELAKLKRLAKDKMGNYKKIIDSSKKERDNFTKKKTRYRERKNDQTSRYVMQNAKRQSLFF